MQFPYDCGGRTEIHSTDGQKKTSLINNNLYLIILKTIPSYQK